MTHLNTIKTAVIVDNQNVGLFFDSSDTGSLISILPDTISTLVDTITKKGIDYQVYNVPVVEPFQVPFIVQLIGVYFLFSFVFSRLMGPGAGGPMSLLMV